MKLAALHLQGKAYAWWLFESFSLKNVNISSYARFTRRLVKIFDVHSETSLKKQIKPKKSESLHELEKSMKPTPFLNIVEGVKYLQYDLPRAKASLQLEHSPQEE